MIRTLPLILFALAGLGSAQAQSYDEVVRESPGGIAYQRTSHHGRYTSSDTWEYGRHGHRCHIMAQSVKTWYGHDRRTVRHCS